jgi:hypothetical protein
MKSSQRYLKFWDEEETGKTVSRAKAWFDKLTTLSKIEGQKAPR